MQVRDLIAELQKIDPLYEIKVKAKNEAEITCQECGDTLKNLTIVGDIEGVTPSGSRCEAFVIVLV